MVTLVTVLSPGRIKDGYAGRSSDDISAVTVLRTCVIVISAPHSSNGWHVHAFNGGAIAQPIITYAMCAAAR